MSMNKPTIGIIGGGFVGQILKKYYPDALMYDINGKFDDEDDVLNQDIVFIAFLLKDNALSEESYQSLAYYPRKARKGTIFVIKSTFVPGTTDRLQKEFPHHDFVYNPEFLTEMTAWKDFTEPQFQILGCTHQSLKHVHLLFDLLPNAPIKEVISPLDAEFLKHAFNSYFALKVTWFNQLYDAMQSKGADYETVRRMMVQHPWIGDSHSIVWHKGYRGYGGKCLSKDPRNLSLSIKFPLIESMEEYNNKLLEKNVHPSSP